MAKYAAAIDQGTTSTRCMVFDHGGNVVSVAQKEHEQIYPKPGWVEHDVTEIWARTQEVVDEAHGLGRRERRRRRRRRDHQPARDRGRVGQDDRRADPQRARLAGHAHGQAGRRVLAGTAARPASRRRSGFRSRPTSRARRSAGSSTTSTAPREKADSGDLLFGNMDTWIIWNLTGGTDGGLHITDVTNASRTMLMDLRSLRLGRRGHGRDGDPGGDAARDPRLVRRLRRGPRGRRAPGRADRRRPRRSAGGHVRPDLLLARRGQEHVRHRQLPAAQHGHGGGRVEERPADHGRLQDRRPGHDLLPRGLDRDHRARSCSGCATTSS